MQESRAQTQRESGSPVRELGLGTWRAQTARRRENRAVSWVSHLQTSPGPGRWGTGKALSSPAVINVCFVLFMTNMAMKELGSYIHRRMCMFDDDSLTNGDCDQKGGGR